MATVYEDVLETLVPMHMVGLRFVANRKIDGKSPTVAHMNMPGGGRMVVFPEWNQEFMRRRGLWHLVNVEFRDESNMALARLVDDCRLILRVCRDVADYAWSVLDSLDEDAELEDVHRTGFWEPPQNGYGAVTPESEWHLRNSVVLLRFVEEVPGQKRSRVFARYPSAEQGEFTVYMTNDEDPKTRQPGWYPVTLAFEAQSAIAYARPVTDPVLLYEILEQLTGGQSVRLREEHPLLEEDQFV